MLAVAASLGLNFAVIVVGSIAVVAALPLMLVRGVDNIPAARHPNEAAAAARRGLTAALTPTIIGLTGFFALLSLSGSAISNFSVVALTGAFGTPLSAANLALTGYLSAQALGVLLGGFIADLTRRHAEVAAVGYAINACIVLAIGTMGLGVVPLVAAMCGAGLLGGLIMPSRDMLVRAAAAPGAMGRTFGIVTSGFNIGGMVGPLMFGFIMDRAAMGLRHQRHRHDPDRICGADQRPPVGAAACGSTRPRLGRIEAPRPRSCGRRTTISVRCPRRNASAVAARTVHYRSSATAEEIFSTDR